MKYVTTITNDLGEPEAVGPFDSEDAAEGFADEHLTGKTPDLRILALRDPGEWLGRQQDASGVRSSEAHSGAVAR